MRVSANSHSLPPFQAVAPAPCADCAQDPGGGVLPASANMLGMTTPRTRCQTRPAHAQRRSLGALSVLLAFGSAAGSAFAMAPGVAGPKTTIVIFSDRPMPDSAWTGLFAQLRREASLQARTLQVLDGDPQLVKGTDVVPGQTMDNPIVVKLHGECRAPAGTRPSPSSGALGWVRREEGRISPFVQVDCTRVAQLIAQRVYWMADAEKSAAMSGAIARVILHEWIHIVEQSDHHGRKGITKPEFGSDDLIRGFDRPVAPPDRPAMAAAQDSKPR